MTVGSTYTNWQRHTPAPDPRFNHCSPNLVAIWDFMAKRWGCTDLGCFGWRAIRMGTAPSSHGFGAARDIRYPDRYVALTQILPWLIDNSEELHLSACHDYIGCRIYHADRQAWKAQSPNPGNGMGQAWATYFHVETTLSGWHDATPIPNRFEIAPPPPIPDPPTPTPIPGGTFVHKTIKLGDENADVYAFQLFAKKVAGNTDIVVDGTFGPITDLALKAVQAWYGLKADGVCGPVTWAKIDLVVNA